MRLRLIIRWDDPDREVTAAHIRARRDAERRRAMEDGEISPYEEADLNPERPAADVFPTVSSYRWAWTAPCGCGAIADPANPINVERWASARTEISSVT